MGKPDSYTNPTHRQGPLGARSSPVDVAGGHRPGDLVLGAGLGQGCSGERRYRGVPPRHHMCERALSSPAAVVAGGGGELGSVGGEHRSEAIALVVSERVSASVGEDRLDQLFGGGAYCGESPRHGALFPRGVGRGLSPPAQLA